MELFQKNQSDHPDPSSVQNGQKSIILGGGLAGLSAGYVLANAGVPVIVFEGNNEVGGLSRTIRHGDFMFDLGGHRFHTKNRETELFVKKLLKGDYLVVNRKSKIFMNNRFFNYPLKPSNALLGMGIPTTIKAVSDYGLEKVKKIFRDPKNISLEDWVVAHFGRTMFTLYFKEYSEKVWGIECNRISEEWVSQRIKGLSLGVAIKNAFKFGGKNVSTLVDEFIYPPFGIGQIPDNLSSAISINNQVITGTKIDRVCHNNSEITNIITKKSGLSACVEGSEFISSIPINNLVKMLDPAPPSDILEAALKLRYRDIVIVTIMLGREQVTDLTWMYLPEHSMPLGRIHEPKNWSPRMAPEGKTHIVAEYFCFKGDNIWNSSDEELASMTVTQLEKLGLINKNEVIDKCIVRTPKAYPLFEVGYSNYYAKILGYLGNFSNLHITGRTGMFKYYNMDRAIESGIEAAEDVLKSTHKGKDIHSQESEIASSLTPVS
ncbi:FAD-dependent oxidoreductase [bacterium]|nr:FAD-dependent oxidoreductase [bacterium]